jgi:hypothetical protein
MKKAVSKIIAAHRSTFAACKRILFFVVIVSSLFEAIGILIIIYHCYDKTKRRDKKIGAPSGFLQKTAF